MRQIVLDTETTGLELELGHRVIEIGCVELVNRRDSGRHFHRYICPDREIDDAALKVHGIRREFLLSQPRFHEVAEELRLTLEHFRVPAREQGEVLGTFAGWKGEVTAGSEPGATNWRRWRSRP